MSEQAKVQEAKGKLSRRNVLKAAMAAGGAAVLGFPMIAKGQSGPISMRFQSTWPQKDIFHEYANDFAKKVNDMTGGDLKIEVLPAGAVVPAFQLARCRFEGHTRRRSRRGRVPLRQADGPRALGFGSELRDGRQHDARVAQVRRRQGFAGQALQIDRRQRRLVSRTARCPPSLSAGSRSRSPRPTTSRDSNSAPWVFRLTCSRGSARR